MPACRHDYAAAAGTPAGLCWLPGFLLPQDKVPSPDADMLVPNLSPKDFDGRLRFFPADSLHAKQGAPSPLKVSRAKYPRDEQPAIFMG